MAGADSQCLAAIGTKNGPVTKIVMIDTMMVFLAILGIQANCHGDTVVVFTGQVIVVKTVVFPVHRYPVI